MKTKNLQEKLVLNKKTVANLTVGEMKKLRGGMDSAELATMPGAICTKIDEDEIEFLR